MRRLSKNNAFDNQCGRVKVQEKPDPQTRRPQIRPQLGEVNVFQSLNCFQLQDDLSIDDQVEPLQSHRHFLKENAHFFLLLVWNAAMPEGNLHSLLIDQLQESWSKRLVDIHRRRQDSAR